MKLLILLVLTGLATASDELGDRIVATEEECGRIFKLNENWSTRNFHDQAAQYVDLYLICQDSLNEDKYAYIDKNMVDMSWYPGEKDKFPVWTREGEKLVTKPPQRKPKDEESMKKRLVKYLTETGGKINPIYRLMSIQSEMSQDIIDKQVECELHALYLFKHPDDKDNEAQHTDCMTELNCMKEKFMEQHQFTREQYPDVFPILYKRRGTMVKTPPVHDKSICIDPVSPEGNKKELEKWMDGVEYIGEKIADIGEAGTDFIEKLVKKGMGAGDKVLTRGELDDLLTDVQSITITDDDEDDDEEDNHTFTVYGDVMMAKLAELEAKGVEIAHAQLEKAKPAIEKVENIASATGEKLKKIEEAKIKPAIRKTANGLSHAELNLKEKSKNALEDVKDGLTATGHVAKIASTKTKEEGSIFMSKLKSKHEGQLTEEEATGVSEDHIEDHEIASSSSRGWLGTLIDRMIQPEYLPDHYGDAQSPGLLKILKEMGGTDVGGKDKKSDSELMQMLKSLKENTRKRAHDLNLNKDEIKQSAEVVKGVMHTLLYAAGYGYGPAKDMNRQEIEKAKSLVDEMVDYATAEILDEDDVNEEGEGKEDAPADDRDAEDNRLVLKQAEDLSPHKSSQENEKLTNTPQQAISHDHSTNIAQDKNVKQSPADSPKEVDETKPSKEYDTNKNEKEAMNQENESSTH